MLNIPELYLSILQIKYQLKIFNSSIQNLGVKNK